MQIVGFATQVILHSCLHRSIILPSIFKGHYVVGKAVNSSNSLNVDNFLSAASLSNLRKTGALDAASALSDVFRVPSKVGSGVATPLVLRVSMSDGNRFHMR